MRRALEVLIVQGEEPVTEALASTLARRGHRVSTASTVESALALPGQDVIVCDARLPGACGFEFLSTVHRRGDGARFVLLLGDPTVDECLRALRLGASDVLAKPFRIEELVRAVESGRPAPEDPPWRAGTLFEATYPPAEESVELVARELSAFALLHGVPPSVRARIAGAAQEVVQNAVRHGRLPAGSRIRDRKSVV